MRKTNNSNSVSRQLFEVISDIEITIKEIIKNDVLDNVSKQQTISKIKKVIYKKCLDLPKNYQQLIASNAYQSAMKFYDKFKTIDLLYKSALIAFLAAGAYSGSKKITYRKLYKQIVESPHHAFDRMPFTRGYREAVKKRILELAKSPMLDYSGKRKTSLFAKAELQVRYENQMNMIDDIKEKGIRLCYISSHSDCSKRCAKWQGKLVDMNAKAINSNFETGEVVDGHKVYSLQAIISQVDKYGYHNNIIVGFNCRHRLVPYSSNKKIPRSYKEKVRKKEYGINENLRKMERTIRDNRKEAYLIKDIDAKQYKALKKIINKQVEAYEKYANANNVKPLIWRTKISKNIN